LGQDTRAILSELGYSASQVDALAQQGAILNGD
jgi:crotonobetainyl-CoA:carnitine CoA-transferase CaiB-like acyl-CoA transferase